MHRGYTCLWRKIWSNEVLAEPGKRFSRLEAWLYTTNLLAAGMDDRASGLKRGEFTASVRQLAEWFNWSRGNVLRFLETLMQNSMIMRVGHSAGQEAGHFSVCNYETYNTPRNAKRDALRDTFKEVVKESIKNIKDTTAPAAAGARVSAEILFQIYQQNNQSLPEVKALTSERLKKCRTRINQAVRDGCLDRYLADFTEAVKKAQQTPFLRGEGARGWRAGFDWFIANQVNVYKVLEGKYDGPAAGPNHGGGNGNANFGGRTSRGDPIYVPRQ
jgi:hypothetical protein